MKGKVRVALFFHSAQRVERRSESFLISFGAEEKPIQSIFTFGKILNADADRKISKVNFDRLGQTVAFLFTWRD